MIDPNPFLSQDIVHRFLHINNLIETGIVFTLGQTNVKISIIHSHHESILLFVKSVIHIIRVVHALSIHKLTDLSLLYYLTDVPKKVDTSFQKNPTLLTTGHINSGSCQKLHDLSAHIIIWRKEEILKVTIHELIHAFEYDISRDSHKLVNHYQQKYNISSQTINTFEGYTETWACILNCFLLSRTPQDFQICLENERIFSDLQTNTILHSTFYDTDINKHTNCLAYYAIRNELLTHLPEFIQFCKLYNQNYITHNSQKKWTEFLLSLPTTHTQQHIPMIQSLHMNIHDFNVFPTKHPT